MVVLRLGDEAPDFESASSVGTLKFHEFIADKWCIFFSHPADFTPVCTTELGTTAKLAEKFAARNVTPIALSVDSAESHTGWIKDINETQETSVNFPIIADPERKVAELYGMLHPNSPDTLAGKLTVRTVFVIDNNKKIRMSLTYPASTGRNFNELIRVIDSLQLTDNYKCATPANWNKGEDVVILPNISDEDAKEKFPKGFRTVKPYLRFTADPSA
mmetsp:Transcript_87050/g.130532  ORF Transcript_87050/g.130532 Transcript_87050/m.130532 type:complete len:217 (-) Transcript_87050:6-656(-)